MRKGFVFYTDFSEEISLLTTEQKGNLLDAILAYAAGEIVKLEDTATQIVFVMLKKRMDKDTERYEEIVASRKEAGAKGGNTKQKNRLANASFASNDSSKDLANVANASFASNDSSKDLANASKSSQKEKEKKKKEKEENNKNIKTYCAADTESETETEPTTDETIPYGEVVDYLNARIDAHYKPNVEATKACIKARFHEGFTLDNFKTVIDNKARDWINTDMAKYLRPQTLFGNKFESYLNEQQGKSPPKKGFHNFQEREVDYDAIIDNLTT